MSLSHGYAHTDIYHVVLCLWGNILPNDFGENFICPKTLNITSHLLSDFLILPFLQLNSSEGRLIAVILKSGHYHALMQRLRWPRSKMAPPCTYCNFCQKRCSWINGVGRLHFLLNRAPQVKKPTSFPACKHLSATNNYYRLVISETISHCWEFNESGIWMRLRKSNPRPQQICQSPPSSSEYQYTPIQ